MQCPTPESIKDPRFNQSSIRITVPCGKCGACQKNRRSDWSFRLKEELKVSSSAFFITLTYADENLPVDNKTGEVTLKKRDLQNFMKSIRNFSSNKLRYYAVGEYGTNTDRPHYHILLFNLKNTEVNYVAKCWKHGHVHVGKVSDASIHYVTKYHVNTKKNEDTREPEFATMSRRPGIGSNYYENTRKWHRENQYFHVVNNGYKQRLPRYYQEKLFTKLERQIRANGITVEIDKNYEKEKRRLENLQIKNPDSYMFSSAIQKAKKVKSKKDDKGVF